MITKHQGLAIDLSTIKAIFIKEMFLVFEFNDFLQKVYNSETDNEEYQSFPNSPISVEYPTFNSLSENLNQWVELWEDSKAHKK